MSGEWIDRLLVRWGYWARTCGTGGLGFPRVSPMFRDGPRGDAYGPGLPMGFVEADILDCDAAVRRLPLVLFVIVLEVYQVGGSLRAIGMRLGISNHAVRKYLTQAQKTIVVDLGKSCSQNPPESARVYQCARKEPAAAR